MNATDPRIFTVNMFPTLATVVSIFALLAPAFALPVGEAETRTFLASLKLNETAINSIKQLRGTQLACGALRSLRNDQVEAKGVSTYEQDRTAHW